MADRNIRDFFFLNSRVGIIVRFSASCILNPRRFWLYKTIIIDTILTFLLVCRISVAIYCLSVCVCEGVCLTCYWKDLFSCLNLFRIKWYLFLFLNQRKNIVQLVASLARN